MAISEPFQRVLAAGRQQFNARAADAVRRTPRFATAAFGAFLEAAVDPVVSAVDAVAPARTTATAIAAYDIALALTANQLVGPASRAPLVERVWRELFTGLAMLIAQAPREVMSALSNAAVQVSSVPGVRADDWLDTMASLGPQAASLAELLGLGQVLAWRAGAAHFRAGAIAAADALPAALAVAAVGATAGSSWSDVRAQLSRDRWWTPQGRRLQGWQLGDFTGFGGRFSQPPEPRSAREGVQVRSGGRHFLIVADGWGAVLLPSTAQAFESASMRRPRLPGVEGDRLVFADRSVPSDLPPEDLLLVADEHTVAFASPWTHVVRVLPMQ